ncbi:TolB family protein [Microbacterium aoyamense]|uniref:TolB family protein n=1 Tax=Microbacterium aoyamense TaxID=344166 RepID=UPI002003A24D|nr:biopolymer transporter Tol [Microbacterium aoyamense]
MPRRLAPGETCRVRICDLDSGTCTTAFEGAELLLEAPNWTSDGRALVLNGQGLLWRLDIPTADLTQIEFTGLPEINNDHVLAPDGETIFLTGNDFHLYRAPLSGGPAVAVTADGGPCRWHFLHGVSPSGTELAYVGIEGEADQRTANIFTLDLTDGVHRQLTFGSPAKDGPEYSPDGSWIFFNTEQFTHDDGHAQLARMRADGSDLTRMTDGPRVDWFPHPSPDSRLLAYLSYEPGTTGHPAGRQIELRLLDLETMVNPITLAAFRGGQGTINVNSWAPDGRRFAFVDYPMDGAGT